MTQHGGRLHESVQIAKDERRGVHLQVKKDWGNRVPKETCIINTPLSATMSYFNAIDYRLSDTNGGEGLFSTHEVVLPRPFIDAVGPEETTVFFLMGQYLQGSHGFWFPWIRTLPQPGSLTTPLYYEREDLEWLDATSLLPAREQKMRLMKDKYETCFEKLHGSGLENAERYTWWVLCCIYFMQLVFLGLTRPSKGPLPLGFGYHCFASLFRKGPFGSNSR